MTQYRAPKGSMAAKENKEKRKARNPGTHTTKPIMDSKMIQKMMDIAKDHDAHRDHGGPEWYLMLVLGFNTGLRIGDLVQLKVKDIRGRQDFTVVEGKTQKERQIHIKWNLMNVISERLKNRKDEEFVLQSRQRDEKTGKARGISTQRALDIMKVIAERAGYEEHIGCHTMRKTYAWSIYKASDDDLTLVQKSLNHSSQAVTMRYIGIEQEDINEAINKMRNMF